MLAKIIHPKQTRFSASSSKARAAKLINYVLAAQEKDEKLLYSWMVNTVDDVDLAVLAFQTTIEANTRAKSNRVEHIIITFSESDEPTLQQFKHIETSVSQVLGYSEHQRVAAVHKNTENIHMHIALNKIHPESHRLVSHFHAYDKLEKLCATIEKRFNLCPRASLEIKTVRRSAGQDYERKKGLQSFESWLREHSRESLKSVLKSPSQSWKALHEHCHSLGVKLTPRGNGLVFSHLSKNLHVKASSVDRCFSLKALEDQLGPFQSGPNPSQKPLKFYTPEPRGPFSRELFLRYKSSRVDTSNSWLEWLHAESQAGDENAKEYLRSRYPNIQVHQINCIVGTIRNYVTVIPHLSSQLNRRGKIEFLHRGKRLFTDSTTHITVHRESEFAIKQALRYAEEAFGKDITFHGTETFVDRAERLRQTLYPKQNKTIKPKLSR